MSIEGEASYRRLERLGQDDPDVLVAIRPCLEVKDGIVWIAGDFTQ